MRNNMKKATYLLLNYFPKFKKHIKAYENLFMAENAIASLNDTEKIFLKLAWFFESEGKYEFNLYWLYQLEGEWLEFALDLIEIFFKEDTYLFQKNKPPHSLLIDADDYLTQTDFARFLQEKGFDYTQNKVAVYRKRGKFPKEDILIAGKPYWSRYTAEIFLRKLELEKKRKESKNDEEG